MLTRNPFSPEQKVICLLVYVLPMLMSLIYSPSSLKFQTNLAQQLQRQLPCRLRQDTPDASRGVASWARYSTNGHGWYSRLVAIFGGMVEAMWVRDPQTRWMLHLHTLQRLNKEGCNSQTLEPIQHNSTKTHKFHDLCIFVYVLSCFIILVYLTMNNSKLKTQH